MGRVSDPTRMMPGPTSMEHSLDAIAHFLMSQVLASVELLQTLPDPLTKPYVMVEITLNQLLNIAIGIAAVLRGDEIQLRLDIGSEMYFHVTAPFSHH